jgi:ligand-binding sensor domain-containing protein/signal transduction histidine kinase
MIHLYISPPSSKQYAMRKNPRRLAGLLAAACLGLWLGFSPGSPALAAAGQRFHVDAWGTHDGLTANEVLAIVQTHDGYLWLGTLNGLARFDGLQFKVFDEHNTPGMPSGRIVFLFEDSKTNLWIGTETAGALLLHDSQITDLGFGKGRRDGRLQAACEDSTGAVWLRADDGELARYHDGKLDSLGRIGPGHTLIAEKSGSVLLGADQIDPAAVRASMPLPATRVSGMSNIDFLLASRTGGRWCLGQDGVTNMVEKWVGDRLELNLGPYPWRDWDITPITAACEDLDGNLIVGTRTNGVWWYGPDRKATKVEGLSGNYVLSLYMDFSGALWVGLDPGGLNRVQRQLFHPLDAASNLTVHSVCEDPQGRLWFSSTTRGIDYWKDDLLKNTDATYPISGLNARALLLDRNSNLWAATFSAGLFRWADDQFRPDRGYEEQSLNPGIYALFQDRGGRLWAGTQRGLACWDGHAWLSFTTNNGLSANIVRAIADDADGRLWIGTEGGGLDCLKDGKITPVQPAGGFPSKNISALYMDPEGVLWIGTLGNGLIRFQSGRWINYTTDNGLNANGVDYIIEDGLGCLWIGSNAGLMRVKKSDLNAFAAGTMDFIPCHSYGWRDGLPSDECTLGSQPAACRAADGTLWFPTIAGLVPIDPTQIQIQTNPSPVSIETVLIEGQDQGANGPHGRPPQSVVVPPGKELLEIRYTCLNLDNPQQVRFQYLMAGYVTNWTDAGQRRAVQFSKLPPGGYLFQVRARNEDGIWNPVAAQLAVTVLPAFWQTASFRAAAWAAPLAGIIAIVYFISTRKMQRQLAGLRQQQALEKDRARIARDIHDQVGASLTQLSLLGEMVESDKDDPAEVALHAGQISQTARETARALDEIVWTVNPSNDTLEGLLVYICKHAQEYLAVAGIRYRLEAPAQLPPSAISPEARHNVFLAAKEAVTNIVKHARATEACIRLRLEPGRFVLEIEDNGRGPAGIAGTAAQSRNGLRNMRKRMEDIGGQFEIRPGAKGGAIVRLTAPLASSR